MPRLLEGDRCPHCGEDLPEERSSVCPACGVSLEQRYLKAGCISSAPPVFLIGALLLRWILGS